MHASFFSCNLLMVFCKVAIRIKSIDDAATILNTLKFHCLRVSYNLISYFIRVYMEKANNQALQVCETCPLELY